MGSAVRPAYVAGILQGVLLAHLEELKQRQFITHVDNDAEFDATDFNQSPTVEFVDTVINLGPKHGMITIKMQHHTALYETCKYCGHAIYNDGPKDGPYDPVWLSEKTDELVCLLGNLDRKRHEPVA